MNQSHSPHITYNYSDIYPHGHTLKLFEPYSKSDLFYFSLQRNLCASDTQIAIELFRYHRSLTTVAINSPILY